MVAQPSTLTSRTKLCVGGKNALSTVALQDDPSEKESEMTLLALYVSAASSPYISSVHSLETK
jgi:hypothetical protein